MATVRAGTAMLLATALSFAALPARRAAADETTYRSRNHFTIDLPPGWTKVPDSVATACAAAVAQRTGQRLEYEAFLERSDAPEHLSYPYVMVAFHAADTRFYREFSEQMETGIKEGVNVVTRRAGDLLTDIDLGKPVSEPAKSRWWVSLQMTVAGVGPVQALSMMQMGDKGIAVVNFYARAADFASWEPSFRLMADNCAFERGWRHDPSKGPPFFSTSLGRIVLFGGIGGFLGLVFGFLAWNRKRRERQATPSYTAIAGIPLSRTFLDPDAIGGRSVPGEGSLPAGSESRKAAGPVPATEPNPRKEEPLVPAPSSSRLMADPPADEPLEPSRLFGPGSDAAPGREEPKWSMDPPPVRAKAPASAPAGMDDFLDPSIRKLR